MNSNLSEKIRNKLSYTNQDYESILQEFKELFIGPNAIETDWDNFAETDPLVILLHLVAAHKDILNYMIDYRTLEGFMSTARERASISRIAQSFGYKISSYRAATGIYNLDNLDSSELANGDKIIVKFGDQFIDNDGFPWVYFNEDETVITSSSDNLELNQGTLYTVNIDFNNINESNRTHILAHSNIAIGTTYRNKRLAKIDIYQSGVLKKTLHEVDNLYRYKEDNADVFELNVDPQGITYIKLHKDFDIDSYKSGYNILLYYITTTGDIKTGNNLITAQVDIISDDEQQVDSKLVTFKQSKFYNGAVPEDTEEIRENFKYYYASSDTLITLYDYKNYMLNTQTIIPEITKCLVIDSQSDTTGRFSGGAGIPQGEVHIYTNVNTSNPDYSIITAEMSKLKLSGTTVVFKDPDPVNIQLNFGSSFNDRVDFINFINNYINNFPIGETLTAGAIHLYINNSIFRDLFNNRNGNVTFRLVNGNGSQFTNIIELSYNQMFVI